VGGCWVIKRKWEEGRPEKEPASPSRAGKENKAKKYPGSAFKGRRKKAVLEGGSSTRGREGEKETGGR